MKKENADETPEYLEYLEHQKSMRRQMLPAIVFFCVNRPDYFIFRRAASTERQRRGG